MADSDFLGEDEESAILRVGVSGSGFFFAETGGPLADPGVGGRDRLRRGLEDIIRHHPPGGTRAEDWTLPPSFEMGEALAPEEEWTAVCHEWP